VVLTPTLYSLNCTGLRNTDLSSSAPLLLQWIDLAANNAIIQYYRIPSPPTKSLLPSFIEEQTLRAKAIQFVRKSLNSPLGDAQFTFSIQAEFELTHKGKHDVVKLARLYVEFPIHYQLNLNMCLIDESEVLCSVDERIQRRVVVYAVAYLADV
jgi:hypothetical protein